MVNAWRRLWDGSTRRIRVEGKDAGRVLETHARPRREQRTTKRSRSIAPRILFVNQYYWPDNASTAQHLTDLAESLARRGFECHVVCSRGGYLNGKGPRPPKFEVREGVKIHRVGATAFGRRSTLGRMTDYLSYYAGATLRSLAIKRFDVVVTLTTPPIIGLIGTLAKIFKQSKHVYWSMDLHPDISLEMGLMSRKNPLAVGLAWLSNEVYRRADRVVALGTHMASRVLKKKVEREHVSIIPVWSRADEIFPLAREGHPLRECLGIQDKFVVMYSGNLGLVHSFDEFLEAARRLRKRDDILFLFVGAGPRRKEVEAARRTEGLENLTLMGYFPRERLHESLSVADAHLISMRKEVSGLVVPGKLYGAMAAARPTLFVGPEHCESADTIREAHCGLTIRLGDVDALVEAITLLAADRDLADAMGRRAREAFLETHEKDRCVLLWDDLLRDLLGVPKTTEATLADESTAPAQASEPVAADLGAGGRGEDRFGLL